MNKQNRNRLINTENKPMVARGEGEGGQTKQVKGINRYKLPAIKEINHVDVTYTQEYHTIVTTLCGG